jgi:hypothetical protein
MRNLFLDDFRIPEDAFKYTHNSDYLKLKWDIVRDYDAFVKYIKRNGMPDMISFDHDLADVHYEIQDEESLKKLHESEDREKTGFDCAKWVIDYCIDNNKKLPLILIHSMNPVGSENIKNLFLSYIKFTEKNG